MRQEAHEAAQQSKTEELATLRSAAVAGIDVEVQTMTQKEPLKGMGGASVDEMLGQSAAQELVDDLVADVQAYKVRSARIRCRPLRCAAYRQTRALPARSRDWGRWTDPL